MANTAKSAIRAREITPEERAHYYEKGWVLLRGLISEEEAAILLAEAKRIASDGVKETHRAGSKTDPGRADSYQTMFRPIDLAPEASEPFTQFHNSPEMGQAAARLLSNPVLGPRKARRLWEGSGTILVKMPEGETGSGNTSWHQDNSFPWDREGSVNFWLALVPMTPDMGTLRFLEGSNRLGRLGRRPHEDLVKHHPGLLDFAPMSPPLTLRPGDVLANDLGTIHSAGPNLTNQTRWAYTCMYFAADIAWTGQPHRFVDDIDLKQWEPFDHPRFPIVGEP